MVNRVQIQLADAAIRFAEDGLQVAGTMVLRSLQEEQPRRAAIRHKFARRRLEDARNQINAALALLREE